MKPTVDWISIAKKDADHHFNLLLPVSSKPLLPPVKKQVSQLMGLSNGHIIGFCGQMVFGRLAGEMELSAQWEGKYMRLLVNIDGVAIYKDQSMVKKEILFLMNTSGHFHIPRTMTVTSLTPSEANLAREMLVWIDHGFRSGKDWRYILDSLDRRMKLDSKEIIKAARKRGFV